MMSPAIAMSPPSIAAAGPVPVQIPPHQDGQHAAGFDHHGGIAHHHSHHIPTAHMLSSLPKEMLVPSSAAPAHRLAAHSVAPATQGGRMTQPSLRQTNDPTTILQMHNSDSALLLGGSLGSGSGNSNGRSFAAPISRGELLRRCAEMSMPGPRLAPMAMTAPKAPLSVPLGGSLCSASAAVTNVSNVPIRHVMPPKQLSLKRINPSAAAEGVGGGFSLKEQQQPRAQKRSKSACAVAMFAAAAAAHSELREEFEDGSSSLKLQQPVKRDLPSLMGSSLSSLDSAASGVVVVEQNEKPAQPKPVAEAAVAQKPISPVSPAQMIRELLKHDSNQDSTQDSTQRDDDATSAHHESFFTKPTPQQIADYTTDIVAAVRNRDISLLRSYLKEEGGRDRLNCRNRFGESLLHAACRRGYDDVARFLLADAGLSVRAKDDYGRTPLHDACWTARPNFELMEVLLVHGGRDAAELLLAKDVRGHLPFDYARREHWGGWRGFVEDRREMILLSYRGANEDGRIKEES